MDNESHKCNSEFLQKYFDQIQNREIALSEEELKKTLERYQEHHFAFDKDNIDYL